MDFLKSQKDLLPIETKENALSIVTACDKSVQQNRNLYLLESLVQITLQTPKTKGNSILDLISWFRPVSEIIFHFLRMDANGREPHRLVYNMCLFGCFSGLKVEPVTLCLCNLIS